MAKLDCLSLIISESGSDDCFVFSDCRVFFCVVVCFFSWLLACLAVFLLNASHNISETEGNRTLMYDVFY